MKINDFIKKWGDLERIRDLDDENSKLLSERDELIDKQKEYSHLPFNIKALIVGIVTLLFIVTGLSISLYYTSAFNIIFNTTLILGGIGLFGSSGLVALYDQHNYDEGEKYRKQLNTVNEKVKQNSLELERSKVIFNQLNKDLKNVSILLKNNILNKDKTISEFENSILVGMEEKLSLTSLLYLAQNDKLSAKLSSFKTLEIDELKKICQVVDSELEKYYNDNQDNSQRVRHRRGDRYMVTSSNDSIGPEESVRHR